MNVRAGPNESGKQLNACSMTLENQDESEREGHVARVEIGPVSPANNVVGGERYDRRFSSKLPLYNQNLVEIERLEKKTSVPGERPVPTRKTERIRRSRQERLINLESPEGCKWKIIPNFKRGGGVVRGMRPPR